MSESNSEKPFQRNGGTYSFLGNPKPKLVVFLGIWAYFGLMALLSVYFLKEFIMMGLDPEVETSFEDKLMILFILALSLPALIVVVQVTRNFFQRIP